MASAPDSRPASTRVLWVDDEYDEGLALLLMFDGFAVDCAATVATGFAMASASIYDGIVIDQRLPDGSGLRLLEMLREGAIYSPVLVLTGFGDIESAVCAIRLGAVDYCQKPLIGDEWVGWIRRLVQVGERQPHTATTTSPCLQPRHTLAALLTALRQYDDGPRSQGVLEPLAEAMSSGELGDSDFVACLEALRGAITAIARGTTLSLVAAETARVLTGVAFRGDIARHHDVADALVGIRAVLARGERPSLTRLAADGSSSAMDLDRLLLLTTGRSFSQWRSILAIKIACIELGSSSEHVAQIAYALGYEHVAQFNREFHRLLSVTPTEFRRLLVSARRATSTVTL